MEAPSLSSLAAACGAAPWEVLLPVSPSFRRDTAGCVMGWHTSAPPPSIPLMTMTGCEPPPCLAVGSPGLPAGADEPAWPLPRRAGEPERDPVRLDLRLLPVLRDRPDLQHAASKTHHNYKSQTKHSAWYASRDEQRPPLQSPRHFDQS